MAERAHSCRYGCGHICPLTLLLPDFSGKCQEKIIVLVFDVSAVSKEESGLHKLGELGALSQSSSYISLETEQAHLTCPSMWDSSVHTVQNLLSPFYPTYCPWEGVFAKYVRVFVYILGILVPMSVVAVERSRGTEEIRRQKLICGERDQNPGQPALGGPA